MRAHPVAELFPMMSLAELDELSADIRANGLREPIWTLDGRIIDGRNRYEACLRAGVEPTFREYAGEPAALASFVISLNLHRRHLTESQRAMVAAKLANLHHGQRADRPANLPVLPVTQSAAADMLNVSERTVRAAVKVRDQAAPEVTQAVERGEVSVSAAASVASLPKQEQMPALIERRAKPTGKPKTGPVADRMREELAEAKSRGVSMFLTWARMTTRALNEQDEFSDEELAAVQQLADAVSAVLERSGARTV